MSVSDLKRLFIYGSCVSRDTADPYLGNQWGLLRYVARQSLISAGSSGLHTAFEIPEKLTNFQRRVLNEDIAGSLYVHLSALAPRIDLLLWDLTDERLGIYALSDGTYITRTYEILLVRGVNYVPAGASLIPFGSDTHFSLWTQACDKFFASLATLELINKIILLNVPWAVETVSGNPTPSSFGTSAITANKIYKRYYDYVREHSQVQLLTPPADMVRADASHQWGLSPFHYQKELYSWMREKLLS